MEVKLKSISKKLSWKISPENINKYNPTNKIPFFIIV